MSGSHSPALVVVSVLIAMLASYTALQLAGRVAAASGWVRRAWLASGSVAMGLGIWSMHFVAMLAFHLPVPIAYDVPLWLLSIVIAMAASWVALFIASRKHVGHAALAAGALVMGVAIAAMHYTGMAAVRIPGSIEYDATLVGLSIAIAIVCAFTALVLARHFREVRTRQAAWAMVASGVIMGFAIAGMHYTGMAAARFTLIPHHHVAHDANVVASRELAVAVIIGTVLILGLALLGSLLDSHLRRRDAEAVALRESRRAMATLLGNLQGMAYRCRHDSTQPHEGTRTVEFASDGALELTGYSPDALTHNRAVSFHDLIHPADAPHVCRDLEEAVRERRAFQLTYRLRTRTEEEKWVSEQGQGVFSPEGELLAVEGFITDITERTRADVELRRARDAAEAANRTKSDFLASMSHELRTPLNSVIGFANVLRKNKAANLRAQDLEYLDRIVGSGKHLLRLINDVLDLSKIEAGKMEVEVAPVSLASLVHDTVAELQGSVREGLSLRTLVPQTDLMIQSDARKLKQVLINLVGNALKFTERGAVTLAVLIDPATGCPSRIEIRDTGIGIPPERLVSIFQPFEQADSGTARRFGGTGLGLAISSSLCELLGYQLGVESTPGVGSTFGITLKAHHSALNPSTGPVETHAVDTSPVRPLLAPSLEWPAASYENRRVLVIDDDEDARTILTEQLVEFGCAVTGVSTGQEGLRVAREQDPELIILDLLMPGMNGWDVMHALKDDPRLRDIPVIVVSGLAERGNVSALGVVDLVPKPVQAEHMARALRRGLGAKRRRVLVVDDDENARLLVCACLQEEPDVEICTAANGSEALAVLRTFTPDVLVLDLMMPELDGIGFLTTLRRELPHFTPSVVVVTAKDLSRVELRRLSEQTLAVFRKDGELERELKQLLHGVWERGVAQTALASAGRA